MSRFDPFSVYINGKLIAEHTSIINGKIPVDELNIAVENDDSLNNKGKRKIEAIHDENVPQRKKRVECYRSKISETFHSMTDFLKNRGHDIPRRSQPKIFQAIFTAVQETCEENDRLKQDYMTMTSKKNDEIMQLKMELEIEKKNRSELQRKLTNLFNDTLDR